MTKQYNELVELLIKHKSYFKTDNELINNYEYDVRSYDDIFYVEFRPLEHYNNTIPIYNPTIRQFNNFKALTKVITLYGKFVYVRISIIKVGLWTDDQLYVIKQHNTKFKDGRIFTGTIHNFDIQSLMYKFNDFHRWAYKYSDNEYLTELGHETKTGWKYI